MEDGAVDTTVIASGHIVIKQLYNMQGAQHRR